MQNACVYIYISAMTCMHVYINVKSLIYIQLLVVRDFNLKLKFTLGCDCQHG